MALRWILLFTFELLSGSYISTTITDDISNIFVNLNVSVPFIKNDNFKYFCNYEQNVSLINDTLCSRLYNFFEASNTKEDKLIYNKLNESVLLQLQPLFSSNTGQEKFCKFISHIYKSSTTCKIHCYDYNVNIYPPCLLFLKDKYQEALRRIKFDNGMNTTLVDPHQKQLVNNTHNTKLPLHTNVTASSVQTSSTKSTLPVASVPVYNEGNDGAADKNSNVDKDPEEYVKSEPEASDRQPEELIMKVNDETADESHVFIYLFIASVLLLLFYFITYNKKRIMALIIEGRRSRSKRRRNSPSYSRLNCNLEEAMLSETSVPTANNSFPY